MKLPPSFQSDQPIPIFTSNDRAEIVCSNESLFKGKIYRNYDLPDDVGIISKELLDRKEGGLALLVNRFSKRI